ncbi:MAG: DUF4175 family protein, partial [Alphaproteobacteria bacterium]|nr:DUF4175 family protein [Alphaproteobacteria bacterium]
ELAAWLTPPEYTGLAPIFLTARTEVTDRDQPVPVAVGSELVARVHGGASLPVLRTGEGAEATEESAFTAVDDANFELQTDIRSGGGIEIRQGDVTLGAWTLDLIPDRAPEIELPVAPKRTQRSVLRIEYQADDDYGLTRVAATIHRLDDDGAPPIILQLPLASTNPASAHETSYHDLTPHPWAGMPVRLEIRAEDHAGQIGKAAPVEMVLPARDFSHPVARAIVEQRRVLALAPDQQRAVRTALGRISERPGDYGEDLTAYLALRIVVARLGYPQDEAGHAAVLELLWEVALRIEDGALSLAERDLRKAQEALRQALDANASNEELEELMAELEKALEQYLDLLDQQAQQSMAQDSPSPLDPSDTIRSREDLEQMLEQTRDLAMTGAREAAQDMLSRLQEMLENLQTAQSRLDDATGDREPLMRELENLMSDQQELMEDTFEQLRARGDSQRFSPGDGEQSANRQEMLRRALGEIMRGIGESGEDIPEELGRAERMMRDAREELERSRPDRAIDPQAQALDQLREGAQKLRSQWAGRQGTQPGEKDQADPLGENRDPLGRLPPGMQGDPTGFVQIPKDADIRRSREILDELYRRAGERHRPAPERDYIDRLLRWY